MTTTELIQLVIDSNLTWASAMTIMSFLLRPVLLNLTRGWVETQRARLDAEKERNNNEKEQTRVLSNVERALNANSNLTQGILQLLQPLASIPGEISEVSQRMSQRADARDQLLRSHGERLNELKVVADAIPQAVLENHRRHFDPQLSAIREAVEQLRQQVEKRTEPITAQDVSEMRAGLTRVERLLNEAGRSRIDHQSLNQEEEKR